MNYPSIRSYLLTLSLLIVLASTTIGSVLTPGLSHLTENSRSDSLITVFIILDTDTQPVDIQLLSQSYASYNRSDNIKKVINKLSTYRSPYQNSIETFLIKNSKQKIIKHWIIPAYTAELTVTEIKILSQMPGLNSIVENVKLNFESPVKISSAPMATSAVISNELYLMNVPALWNKGLKGKGSLVCSFDTGVDGTHPALESKWRGNHADLSASWFSKVAPDSTPRDATGHGTHTMGVMIGSLDADSFGVAPDAEWISAGVVDQGRNLSMTLSDIVEAFQWALNPDGDTATTDDVPDVILNSWGIPKGLFLPCDDTFWGVIDNVEAAGIVTIFAAGNEGPEPMSLRSPADRATTPLNSFSVGAVNLNREIADFSSRGPSSCDPTQIKPEIVAPGVNIRSSTKGGGFAYMSGTSMSAPYIAGAVALIRQYNKNATVTEIKNAFIQSAIDLGTNGDDNAYGNGFVDLQSILQYIPLPQAPEYDIISSSFVDELFVLPGDSTKLQLTLNNPSGNVENALVKIIPMNPVSATILIDSAQFFFGVGGTVAQNIIPFELLFDINISHGEQLEFKALITSSNSSVVDTVNFSLTVGVIPSGNIGTHQNSKLNITVSDFGAYGFAPGSSYNLSADGFKFNGSENLLYESGIIIGRSALQMSTSIRDIDGSFKPSDFSPTVSLSSSTMSASGDESRSAIFDDRKSSIPIPIDVKQETIHSNQIGEEGLLLVKYSLHNYTVETITGLHFGLLHDFDLSSADKIEFDGSLSLIYQIDNSNMYVGVVALKNISTFKIFANQSGKRGFSNYELMNTISDTSNSIDNTISGDLMFMTTSNKFSLFPNDSIEIAFAYVAGNSLNELYDNAILAKQKFDFTTDIDENILNLPIQFELFQNYPNPFNPTTTISFNLAKSEKVQLDIYNVIGQKVKTLFDAHLSAGLHNIEWDATDNANTKVASGIYFYRLSTENEFNSQKMTLLK